MKDILGSLENAVADELRKIGAGGPVGRVRATIFTQTSRERLGVRHRAGYTARSVAADAQHRDSSVAGRRFNTRDCVVWGRNPPHAFATDPVSPDIATIFAGPIPRHDGSWDMDRRDRDAPVAML